MCLFFEQETKTTKSMAGSVSQLLAAINLKQ